MHAVRVVTTRRNGHIPFVFALFVFFVVAAARRIEASSYIYGNVVGEWRVAYEGNIESGWMSVGSESVQDVNVTIYNVDLSNASAMRYFQVQTASARFAVANKTVQTDELVSMGPTAAANLAQWQGVVQVEGRSFGYTELYVTLQTVAGNVEHGVDSLDVVVVREQPLDNKIFTITATTLALLVFVNLGTALNMERMRAILSKPVGPLIAFCLRYFMMPTLALAIGMLLLRHSELLQLALLFTALAPSGGLASIATVFLKGNLNLAIASTAINSLLAIAMLPLWLFAIAPEVYKHTRLTVPFLHVALVTVVLIIVLSVGALLRTYRPKTTIFVFKYLKPCCMFLSVCLIGVTVGLNAFVFQLITVDIFFAAALLTVLGYLGAFMVSKGCRRSFTDAMTISIETGVVNMSLPIVLLQYSLSAPKADIVMIVPITTALFSLCISLSLYIVRRFHGWQIHKDPEAFDIKEFLCYA